MNANETHSAPPPIPGAGNTQNLMIFGRCRAVSTFEKVDRIGEGTYGTVYRAIDKQTLQVVALKRVILHGEKTDGFPITSIREITALHQCEKCENCVCLLDVVVGLKRDSVFLVFEYCEHDLHSLVKAFKVPFGEPEIKSILQQLLSALKFLHKRDIIHRDIKLSNLLYTNQGQLKLADFGMSRNIPSSSTAIMTTTVVTLWYRAPELLMGYEKYSCGVDIWAAGCIFGELLANKPVFPGENDIDQLYCIFDMLGYPNTRIWPELSTMPLFQSGVIRMDNPENIYNNLRVLLPSLNEEGFELLNLFLAYDSKKRITAKNALTHNYFFRRPYPTHATVMPTFPCLYGEIPAAKWDKVKAQREAESTIDDVSASASATNIIAFNPSQPNARLISEQQNDSETRRDNKPDSLAVPVGSQRHLESESHQNSGAEYPQSASAVNESEGHRTETVYGLNSAINSNNNTDAIQAQLNRQHHPHRIHYRSRSRSRLRSGDRRQSRHQQEQRHEDQHNNRNIHKRSRSGDHR